MKLSVQVSKILSINFFLSFFNSDGLVNLLKLILPHIFKSICVLIVLIFSYFCGLNLTFKVPYHHFVNSPH
jgi:flagellar biosynthesis protein FlhB